jgi:DNA anti-recombination protein RmuC
VAALVNYKEKYEKCVAMQLTVAEIAQKKAASRLAAVTQNLTDCEARTNTLTQRNLQMDRETVQLTSVLSELKSRTIWNDAQGTLVIGAIIGFFWAGKK